MNQQSDTPETERAKRRANLLSSRCGLARKEYDAGQIEYVLPEVAERLERERDEARKMQRDRTDERDAALRDRYLWEQERDQLRKVADRFRIGVEAKDAGLSSGSMWINDALDGYNKLPHVIARKQ